ncbi:hypothetical protein MNB_SV-14-1535 [hydrothermal vent metagenome]|uniref:Uncharacterized protein n=1 Tax=hydrothermal vent metagenome TaxID=652676 RepID=A0A1W1CGV8_9ZZZZ
MEIINKKNSLVARNGMSKNIITAGLAFTLSTFTTLKPMDKGELNPNKKNHNQYNELKIESDAYDMIRKQL